MACGTPDLRIPILNKAKIHYWDTVARDWSDTQPQSLWRAHSDAINISFLARWMPAAGIERVLKTDLFDEAYSQGLYPFLSANVKTVFGMDISELPSRAARSRYNGFRTICADVRQLPFVDEAFDLLVSNSTLDHFESHEEIIASLRELHRVLQPGGHLLLTLDNMANPAVALRNRLPFRLLNRLGIVPYYVGASFGPWRLKSVLQRMDFEVTEVTSLMHFPRVLGVAITRLLERHATTSTQQKILRFLLAFERLSKLPTRFITGQFVAVKAVKRS
jgi:SAM-dependent methyltransferase